MSVDPVTGPENGADGSDQPDRGADQADSAPLTALTAPRDGVPPVMDRVQLVLEWCERAARAPQEPVAVDAERASSFRYSARAYLIQLRTKSAGTALIDPLAFTLPDRLQRELSDREWVLHAAAQDLPCLADLGLAPARLFDTELAARLLGMERVGLGAVVADTLGLSLAKEHSAADWSRRPLPQPWLAYAALDVEVLVDVRDELARRLEQEGKSSWAAEEFEHERTAPAGPPRSASWRGLHGVGALRSAQQMAAGRAMWQRRDEIAHREDLSPHRVIRDRDLVAAAKESVRGRDAFLAALPRTLHHKDQWWKAARSGLDLPRAHQPARSEPAFPPPHKLWSKKWPDVWVRYTHVREAVSERADQLRIPAENLLTPGVLRTWVWSHERAGDLDQVEQQLLEIGARPWQAQQVAPVLRAALSECGEP